MMYSYEEANAYISDIPRFTSKNEPEKTRAFLEYLTDISETIPTVHVAGTNGKGSVCAYLCSAFKEAGLRAAMFTSPHLVSIRERFICDGEMISREDFTRVFNELMNKVKAYNETIKAEVFPAVEGDKQGLETVGEYHPTYFEFLFFMGVLYFENIKPDVLVLETGLGGRLDATNSIMKPKLCVITEIGLDHMEYLGESKEEIAGEKAGIIKPHVPFVYLSKAETRNVFEQKAREKESVAYGVSSNSYEIINYTASGIDFLLSSRYHKNVNLTVASPAQYQVENASLAFTALEVLMENCEELGLTMQAICDGIANMKWPGRMEKAGANFFIDGAHNEDGIQAFLQCVSDMKCKDASLLYSAVSDKQVEEITDKIIESGLFNKFYVAKLDSYRAAELSRLEKCFEEVQDQTRFFDSVELAMNAMFNETDNDTKCFAVGSLYLVGEIKRIYR